MSCLLYDYFIGALRQAIRVYVTLSKTAFYVVNKIQTKEFYKVGYKAYFSGHLALVHLGLAFVLMLRPFFPELVMSMDLLSIEHPTVLLFCL